MMFTPFAREAMVLKQPDADIPEAGPWWAFWGGNLGAKEVTKKEDWKPEARESGIL